MKKRKRYNLGVQGLGTFGSILTNTSFNELEGLINLLKQEPTVVPGLSVNTNRIMAKGGKVGSLPVNVEGQEAYELPNGQSGMFKGKSHENGGINLNLPIGTNIYSKRIKLGKESMAKRKEKRDKVKNRLINKYNKNKTPLMEQTLNLMLENLKIEDNKDLMYQAIKGKNKGKKMADGGTVGSEEHFLEWAKNLGVNVDDNYLHYLRAYRKEFDINNLVQPLESINPNTVNVGDYSTSSKIANPEGPVQPIGKIRPFIDLNPINPDNYKQAPMLNSETKEGTQTPEEFFNSFMGGEGDDIGMIGSAINGVSPLMVTLLNRLGDKPNVNLHKNYGTEGLKNYNDALNQLKGLRGQQLGELKTSHNANLSRNRNSARGINTLRALDNIASQGYSSAKDKLNSNFNRIMFDAMNKKTGLLDKRDSIVMQGETQRDLADRQDRDNFYTNLNKDITNLGVSLQTAGGNINEQEYKKMFLKLLPKLIG